LVPHLVFLQQKPQEVVADLDFVRQRRVGDGELGEVPGDQGAAGQLTILEEGLDLGFECVQQLLPGLYTWEKS
jgi:hypothetical protein